MREETDTAIELARINLGIEQKSLEIEGLKKRRLVLQNKGKVILAPYTGVYYDSPSPGSESYLKVGDIVQPGQTVALIEAMKVFSEIPYEGPAPAKIVKIIAKSGRLVDMEDPLFLLEPIS